MAEPSVQRGSERVALACKAISAACADLRVACVRDGTATDAVEDLTDALDAEAERVCELAAELEALAEVLANRWARRESVRPRGLRPRKQAV
jgi:hypothetical protein